MSNIHCSVLAKLSALKTSALTFTHEEKGGTSDAAKEQKKGKSKGEVTAKTSITWSVGSRLRPLVLLIVE